MSYPDLVFRFAALILFTTVAAAQTAGPLGRIKIIMERKGSAMDFSLPQYKLTLKADGSLVFVGKHNVSAMGIHKRKIESKAVEQLARRFEEIHYFDLPEHLGSCTDAATVVTSVMIGNRTHEVRNWECGTTPSLTELENEIDQRAKSKVWIRGRLRLWLHWPWFHSQS